MTESNIHPAYIYENDTILQKVEIKHTSDTEIQFVLTSKNKKSKSTAKINSIAKRKGNVDPEINEDEGGNSYMADEYIMEKEQFIAIRIDLDSGNKVQINADTPFRSVGILRPPKN